MNLVKIWWWLDTNAVAESESVLLMEDSGNILMEDNSNILTE